MFQQKIDALKDHLQAFPFSGGFFWHYIKCDYLQNRVFPFFSEITVLRLENISEHLRTKFEKWIHVSSFFILAL